MCRKFGGRFVIATDACTGKMRSRYGLADQNPGGARTIPDGKFIIDQDMNGTHGNLLRARNGNLSRFQAMGKDVAFVAERIKRRHRDMSLTKKRTCKVLFLFLY